MKKKQFKIINTIQLIIINVNNYINNFITSDGSKILININKIIMRKLSQWNKL